jgi:hypothetical protein
MKTLFSHRNKIAKNKIGLRLNITEKVDSELLNMKAKNVLNNKSKFQFHMCKYNIFVQQKYDIYMYFINK